MIVVLWIAFSFVPALIAQNKGRSGGGYLLLSLLLSPLIGLLFALVARADPVALEKRTMQTGGMRKCPFCAELVKKEAIVCRHCGKDLPAYVKESAAPPVAAVPTGPPKPTEWAPLIIMGVLFAIALAVTYYMGYR